MASGEEEIYIEQDETSQFAMEEAEEELPIVIHTENTETNIVEDKNEKRLKIPISSAELVGLTDEEIAEVLKTLTDCELEDLFNKNTESFRCLAQIPISRSSLLRHILYHFPEIKDPGIDEAFDTVEPEQIVDDIGGDKYVEMCKVKNIGPLTRVISSLNTETMNLKYYGLSEKQFKAIASSLTWNTRVKNLILDENLISPESAYLLAEMLRENDTIEALSLKQCRLGPQGIKALVDGLALNQSIRELDLSVNELGDKGLATLLDGIKDTNITKLNLSHNDIPNESAKRLANFIENSNLNHLDLSWNDLFSPAALKQLCAGILNCPQLKYLNLSWNGIGSEEAVKPISRLLKNTEGLEHFDISCNRLMGQSLTIIKNALAANNTLISVNLGFNQITPADALMLVGAFKRESPLKYMDLKNVFVDKSFLPARRRLTNMGKSVRIEGVLRDWVIHGPDKIQLIFKRCQYLSQKKKKDFGSLFIYNLPKEIVDKAKFRSLIKKSKIKLDRDLIEGLANLFPEQKKLVNLEAMRKTYLKYYPNTQPPPEKNKKGKGKNKGKKTKEENGDTAQIETEEKGIETDKDSMLQKSSIVTRVDGPIVETVIRPSDDQPEKLVNTINFNEKPSKQTGKIAPTSTQNRESVTASQKTDSKLDASLALVAKSSKTRTKNKSQVAFKETT